MVDNPIFSPDELRRMQEQAEDIRSRELDRKAAKFFESDKYRPVLEQIQADRKTHMLIFDLAAKLKGNIEAVCIEPFAWPLSRSNMPCEDLGIELNYETRHGKARWLWEEIDTTPDLYLHITPNETNYSVGAFMQSVKKQWIIPVGVACDFLKNCSFATQVNYVAGDYDVKYAPVDPEKLIPSYKRQIKAVIDKPFCGLYVYRKDLPKVDSLF